LASGAKKMIVSDRVRVISIPQYEGLKVESMLEFASQFKQVFDHLPVEKEVHKLSRSYLGNVIYTIVGEPFYNWVQIKINERHDKIKEKKEMMIDLDPAIAKIFQESSSVSVAKGNSSFLMKQSAKRRRTKLEILEDKAREDQKERDLQTKLEELENLKLKMQQIESRMHLAQKVEQQFQKLASEGKMKLVGQGEVEVVDDPKEREWLAESNRKQQMAYEQASDGVGKNLMGDFDEEDDGPLE